MRQIGRENVRLPITQRLHDLEARGVGIGSMHTLIAAQAPPLVKVDAGFEKRHSDTNAG